MKLKESMSHKVSTIYLFMFLFVILSGCAPSRYEYYEPKAAGGSLSLSIPSIMTVKDTIEFSFDNTKLKVIGKRTGIYLILYVPKNKVARFLTDELEWHTMIIQKKMQAPFFLEYYHERTNKIFQVNPTVALVQSSSKSVSLDGPESGIYENSVKFSENQINHYFVKLPAIKVNEEVFQIPVIEFIKKEGFGIFPINA